jgi:hypothetical protein
MKQGPPYVNLTRKWHTLPGGLLGPRADVWAGAAFLRPELHSAQEGDRWECILAVALRWSSPSMNPLVSPYLAINRLTCCI